MPLHVSSELIKVSLDPAEWVPKGYAIVNVDPRGINDSEGDMRYWGTAEGRDGYDLVEELAKLPWNSGKIALAGNSWLAMAQWFIAAEQPPHLAAIAPLEGISDPFREESFRGGIPWTTFSHSIAEVLSGACVVLFSRPSLANLFAFRSPTTGRLGLHGQLDCNNQ